MKYLLENRKAKIDLLKSLQSGTVSIDEIVEPEEMLWNCVKGVYTKFLDSESKQLNTTEFEAFVNANPKVKHVVFSLDERYKYAVWKVK